MKIMFSTRSKARAFAQKRTASGIPSSVKDVGVEMKAQGKSRYYVSVNKQKGFTLFELVFVLVWLSVLSFIGFVAVHFISKFW